MVFALTGGVAGPLAGKAPMGLPASPRAPPVRELVLLALLKFHRVNASDTTANASDTRKNHFELKLHSTCPLTVLEAWN